MLLVNQETGYGAVYNGTILNLIGGFIELSITWRTYDTNGKSTVAGTCCSLYNTTQQSVVSFVNNTRMISPSIKSYNSPLNADPPVIIEMCPACWGSNNATSVSLYTYALIGYWLFGQLEGTLVCGTEHTHSNWTLGYCGPSTNPNFNLASNNLFSLNETAQTFTPNSKNVSRC